MGIDVTRKLVAAMRIATGTPHSAVDWTYRVGLDGSNPANVASVRAALDYLSDRAWVRKLERTRPPQFWLSSSDNRRQGAVREVFSDEADDLRRPPRIRP